MLLIPSLRVSLESLLQKYYNKIKSVQLSNNGLIRLLINKSKHFLRSKSEEKIQITDMKWNQFVLVPFVCIIDLSPLINKSELRANKKQQKQQILTLSWTNKGIWFVVRARDSSYLMVQALSFPSQELKSRAQAVWSKTLPRVSEDWIFIWVARK